MRGAPQNFTIRELLNACDQCHDAGAKLYLTVNTITYQREQAKLKKLLDAVAGHVDAIICWDPAVFLAAKERNIPFHISTQASVANADAARFYKNLGATRIVLARECTLGEINSIAKNADIELEVFAHGAMCVSVSGRCFLSQDTYGHSGNRGDCRQNCRRPYKVICQDGPGEFEVTPNDNHVFSAKDLCTLPFIDKLLQANVASLKIEGRNRPPDYVDTVIRAYRAAIDAWKNGTLDETLKQELVARCKTTFNRDFSNGFFLGRPITDFTQHENNASTQKRILFGKVLNYFQKTQIVHLLVQSGTLKDGDQVLFMGPTSGVVRATVENVRLERDDKPDAPLTATFKLPERVRANDLAYLVLQR